MKPFLALALALMATAAPAATYTFQTTFDGTSISLDPGYNSPDGLSLNVGDSIVVGLHAAGADFWQVTAALQDAFAPLDFLVAGGGSRKVSIETAWSLDGVVQHQTSEANVTQEEVHLGAQTWSLNQGLMFDNVTLSLQLLSSTSVSVADEYAPTVLSAAGADIFTDFPDIIFGQPQPSLFFHGGPGNGQIIYVSAVPLPAGIALYLPLLVLGGMKVLRRRA